MADIILYISEWQGPVLVLVSSVWRVKIIKCQQAETELLKAWLKIKKNAGDDFKIRGILHFINFGLKVNYYAKSTFSCKEILKVADEYVGVWMYWEGLNTSNKRSQVHGSICPTLPIKVCGKSMKCWEDLLSWILKSMSAILQRVPAVSVWDKKYLYNNVAAGTHSTLKGKS